MAKDDKTKQEGIEETIRKWLVTFYQKLRKFESWENVVLHEGSFAKNVISETLSIIPVPQPSQ